MTEHRTETDSMGAIEVAADRYWGAQTQRSLHHFAIGERRDRMPREVIRAHGHPQEGGRAGQPGARASSTPTIADLIVQAADEVIDGQARRPVPARTSGRPAPARRRNMNVNEVISNRAIELAGGELGSQEAGPPQRPRQHVAVLERHVPDRDAHRRGRGRSCTTLVPSVRALRDALAQGRRVRRHRQDRPHAPAGRGAADARPGVRRLRRPARRRPRAHRSSRCPASTSSRSAAPRSAPGSTRTAEFAEPCAAKIAEITGLPFVTRAEQVRRARPRTTPWCSPAARSRRWRWPDEDRQRHPLAGARARAAASAS